MFKSKYVTIALKTILNSDKWHYKILRNTVSRILFITGIVVKPMSLFASNFIYIYACVFAFDSDRLARKINSQFIKLDRHLTIASRAFFEMAFTNGKLPSICGYLKKTTILYPNLFTPWKLLHYCYYFTKSWDSLSEVSGMYERFRREKLEAVGLVGYDVIVGDHITASIGHSLIFFDFEIFNTSRITQPLKIAVYASRRDRMSSFYKEIVPGVIANNVSVDVVDRGCPDLASFIQHSFPFLVTKEYFDYSDEKGRARHLSSWAATGARAFNLTENQKAELDLFVKSFGLSSIDWYVVLHVREAPDGSIRNADIDTYYGAIEAITSNGGWVFRIGDVSMTPLREGMHRVVDLPFSKVPRPQYIDLYLLATARFVICTCSGPCEFPFYFNVPRLMTNRPFMAQVSGTPNDICLPVSYYCTDRKEIVSLREQLTSAEYDNEPKLNALTTIIPIKNTTQQIQDSAIEMIKFTDQIVERANFPRPKVGSLFHEHKGRMWFMGSISKSFLADNPNYLE